MKEKIVFESYTTKSGETEGRPWKLFLLKTEDGRTFSTFDTDFVKLHIPIEIEYEEETTSSGFTRRRIISPEKKEEVLTEPEGEAKLEGLLAKVVRIEKGIETIWAIVTQNKTMLEELTSKEKEVKK